jgi:hypothetical protein
MQKLWVRTRRRHADEPSYIPQFEGAGYALRLRDPKHGQT